MEWSGAEWEMRMFICMESAAFVRRHWREIVYIFEYNVNSYIGYILDFVTALY